MGPTGGPPFSSHNRQWALLSGHGTYTPPPQRRQAYRTCPHNTSPAPGCTPHEPEAPPGSPELFQNPASPGVLLSYPFLKMRAISISPFLPAGSTKQTDSSDNTAVTLPVRTRTRKQVPLYPRRSRNVRKTMHQRSQAPENESGTANTRAVPGTKIRSWRKISGAIPDSAQQM